MRLRSLGALALLLGLGGCLRHAAFGYRLELTNGYHLSTIHSGAAAVVDDGGRLITDHSDYGILLAVVGPVIVGNLDTEEDAFGVPPVRDRYFVVHTRAGFVRDELSEAAYRSVLRQVDIAEPPRLRRPNLHTRFGPFGRLREAVMIGLWLAAIGSLVLVPIYYGGRRLLGRRTASRPSRLAWALPPLLFIIANVAERVM
jgi:hypothetical protein